MDIAQIRSTIQSIRNDFIPVHTENEHWYKHEETGIVVPSVTTVIGILDKPWLARWKVHEAVRFIVENYSGTLHAGHLEAILDESMKVSERKVSHAQVVGTTVHNAIEEYIGEWILHDVKPKSIMQFFDKTFEVDHTTHLRYDTTSAQSIAAIRSAQELIDSLPVDAVPLASEVRVGDAQKGYAGTLDIVWLIDGKIELWDWKTSNQISETDPAYPMQISIYKEAFQKRTGLRVKKLKIVQLSKHEDRYKVYEVGTSDTSAKAFLALLKYYDSQRGVINHYTSKYRNR